MTAIANYNAKEVEKRWQKMWEFNQSFKPEAITSNKPKYYVLEMFPYPSGRIHMGHLRNYAIGDVVARFKRAQGFNVLHPMGWDAFGLPAENAAIENNVHPGKWTLDNVAFMRDQLKSIGLSYDWDREFATCTPEYYQHEQRMFLKFLAQGIAYQKEATVNWDPVDQTVLANEQVVDGKGWRSGAVVERKKLTQWFLRISDYADELLDLLGELDGWPDKVRLMQEKWIGKSSGATIWFEIDGGDTEKKETLEIYTTRPDTLFGAAFCAIAPNHPMASKLASEDENAAKFIEECNQLGVSEEAIEKAEKKGFDTGIKIIHPFTGKHLPLYIANFVLMDYGSGAVFGCPAHDQRDFDFASKYNLPIIRVIEEKGADNAAALKEAYTGSGVMVNSDFLNGLKHDDAKEKVIERLEGEGRGNRTINYRIRDWGVSRQRYWGCPIPIIHCSDCGEVPVPDADLPVELPEDVSFDKPGNPLDHHPTWKHIACPECGKDAERETDTFDTFFESSWYFLQFCSENVEQGIDKEACNYWQSVDQYIGGIEHAVLHLLYARFFTLALQKCGYIDNPQPFKGLLTQGMVCHETYQDAAGKWLYPKDIYKGDDGNYRLESDDSSVTVGRIEKMSKSKKNVVDPEGIISIYGADTARLFMLSDSPPDRDLEWSNAGVEGAHRYVGKLWKLIANFKDCIERQGEEKLDGDASLGAETLSLLKSTHKTINAVTQDLERCHLNKAIARIRELTNLLASIKQSDDNISTIKASLDTVVLLIGPMLPHLAEELWQHIGNDGMVVDQEWPKADPQYLTDDEVTIAIQFNGKLKATIKCSKDASKESVQEQVLAHEPVKSALEGKTVKRVIVVPNKIVNVVI